MPKSEVCFKCQFVANRYVPTRGNPRGKVCIIAESPGRREAKEGDNLVGMSGDFIFKCLAKFGLERKDTFRFNVVKCFPDGEKVLDPTTKRCFKLHKHELERFKGNLFILVGNFAVKRILELELKETHGKVIKKDGNYYACIYHPAYYIRRHVIWNDGVPDKDSVRKAYGEFLKVEGKTIEKLFKRESGINFQSEFEFPFTHISSPEEMLNILQSYEGKIVTYDLETECLVNVKGRSALDWFYGKEYCSHICTVFTFFQSLEETTYAPGKFTLEYPKEKVVVYSGEWTPELAKALHRTKAIAFNATYDSGVILKHTGVRVRIYGDPMDACYLLNQGRKKYNLESLAYEYVPELSHWGGEIKARTKKEKTIRWLSESEIYKYCAGDGVVTSILYFLALKEIKKQKLEFIYNIVMEAKTALRDMEANGITVNDEMWKKVSKQLKAKVEILLRQLRNTPEGKYYKKKYGVELNPNSNPQLLEVYNHSFPQLNFTSLKKEILLDFLETEEGKDHTFTKLLLLYRKIVKEYNTYVKGIEQRRQGQFVYASFKTNTTRSGRTSSGGSDVVGLGKTNQINIQNIPRESAMRALFRARPEYYLLSADYSQIEVRVAGAYARSEEILEACVSGLDFHSYVASKAFKIPYDELIKLDEENKEHGIITYRQRAKTITFGILYGMTAEGLAKRLGMKLSNGQWDIESAQQFIDDYFDGMQSIYKWIKEVHGFVEKNLYIRTATGRIRKFNKLDASVYRKAVNTCVQSTASDIFLMALNTIKERLEEEKVIIRRAGRKISCPLYINKINFWGEVHDEVVLEVHKSVPEEYIKEIVRDCMENKIKEKYPFVREFMWKIPLEADCKATEIWQK